MNTRRQFLARSSAAADIMFCGCDPSRAQPAPRPSVRARSCPASDTAYPWEMHPVDYVLATRALSDEERGILGGNAVRVFGFET
jgi:hypothetical protein